MYDTRQDQISQCKQKRKQNIVEQYRHHVMRMRYKVHHISIISRVKKLNIPRVLKTCDYAVTNFDVYSVNSVFAISRDFVFFLHFGTYFPIRQIVLKN